MFTKKIMSRNTFSCVKSESVVTQSCLTLCNPMDCRLPGSSGYGIFLARILEWLPFPSPEDLPNPGIKVGSLVLQADSLPSEPPGKLTFHMPYTLKTIQIP